MGDSMNVYVPAMAFQKAIGLGRWLLFLYLMSKVEYGLWTLGSMIFTMASPILTLGSNMGLVRYVSFYEEKGRLEAFYRRIRWAILAICLALTVAMATQGNLITGLVIVPRGGERDVSGEMQRLICWAAIANALVLALYLNLLGFLNGMRAYRAVSALELVFAVLFTVVGCVALRLRPTGLAVLLAHFFSLAALLGVGLLLLGALFRRHQGASSDDTARGGRLLLEPPSKSDEIAVAIPLESTAAAPAREGLGAILPKILWFGLVSLVGSLLWQGAGYISLFLTNRQFGPAAGGLFGAFLLLSQTALFVGNAAWAVVFSHVTRRWESGQQAVAIFVMETAYKAICLVIMTLTVAVYITSPLWVRILPPSYREGIVLLGGQLMFFQVISNLALMTMIAKLQERPSMIALAALAGGAANAVLAIWWMAGHSAAEAAAWAAWAAGVGLYVGGGVVTLAYFLIARVKLSGGTWILLACPALLLLGYWAAAVWAVVLAVALLTPLVFEPRQQRLLASYVRNLFAMAARILGRTAKQG